jgi:hypothetical protein
MTPFYDHVCINCGATDAIKKWDHLEKPCTAEFKYNLDPDNFGDIMTVEQWLDDCEDGLLIDYDGFCNPMKEGKVCDIIIYPSERRDLPKDATHVIWFNR